jgi:hypothetical protein
MTTTMNKGSGSADRRQYGTCERTATGLMQINVTTEVVVNARANGNIKGFI